MYCGLTPIFPVATFRYQPHGWENQARFLAPDAHVVELRGLGAQYPSLYHHDAGHTWFIQDSRSPGRIQQKNILGFFACLARGRGG
jgi:hypothetical protein